MSSLQILRDELLNFRETFEIFGHFDSFEESFFARDPDCRNVPSITTFDLYVSTVLPLDHKGIRYGERGREREREGEREVLVRLRVSLAMFEEVI